MGCIALVRCVLVLRCGLALVVWYARRQAEVEPCGRELAGNFAWNCDFHVNSGIFYMPQICDMGPTALLPFRRKACWGFFHPENSWRLRPGLNPRTWVLKGSTLPLDHRSRLCPMYPWIKNFWYTMNRGISGSQSLSACFREQRNCLTLLRSKPSQHKAHSLVTILTMPMKDGWGDKTQ